MHRTFRTVRFSAKSEYLLHSEPPRKRSLFQRRDIVRNDETQRIPEKRASGLAAVTAQQSLNQFSEANLPLENIFTLRFKQEEQRGKRNSEGGSPVHPGEEESRDKNQRIGRFYAGMYLIRLASPPPPDWNKDEGEKCGDGQGELAFIRGWEDLCFRRKRGPRYPRVTLRSTLPTSLPSSPSFIVLATISIASWPLSGKKIVFIFHLSRAQVNIRSQCSYAPAASHDKWRRTRKIHASVVPSDMPLLKLSGNFGFSDEENREHNNAMRNSSGNLGPLDLSTLLYLSFINFLSYYI